MTQAGQYTGAGQTGLMRVRPDGADSSCVLMYKQELPLMYPDDPDVLKVKSVLRPFEYLWARHKGDALKTEFTTALGSVAYQVACHQRVQNIGLKTRDVLNLVNESDVTAYERCSGHDGTYAVKKKPVTNR
ncbi:MAG: hypothetical protein CM15mP125_1670 [Gammaproteobacteria bacterium]|nr:MAG: hypothetical protein CM15mP125_1670 [Gammaproteobacteria bacterium]